MPSWARYVRIKDRALMEQLGKHWADAKLELASWCPAIAALPSYAAARCGTSTISVGSWSAPVFHDNVHSSS